MSSNPHEYLSPAEALAMMPDAFAEARAKVDASKRRAAWLKEKQGKLGASSGWKFWTATLQIAKNKTVEKYLKRKAAELDGLRAGELRGVSIRHGNDEETPGAIEFIRRSGIALTKYGDDQEWIAWKENDQVGATPDGLILGHFFHPRLQVLLKDATLVFEQKNNDTIEAYNEFADMESGNDLKAVNLHYWIQMQHQMMVTDAVAGVFQARYSRTDTDDSDIAWFVVDRDDEFIAAHAARLHQAVIERDSYRQKRSERKLVNLTGFITQ